MSRLAILILTETYYPEVGGGETQAAVLSHGLQSRGHEVILVTRRSRPELALEEVVAGLRVVRVGTAGRSRGRKWALVLAAVPALWRLRHEYAVMLVSGYRFLGVPALLVGGLLRKPVVLKADSSGEMSGEFFRAGLLKSGWAPDGIIARGLLSLRNHWLRRAPAFVAISSEIADELTSAGVAPERLHAIPNGIDTSRFHPVSEVQRDALKARLVLPAGPVVTYTGRLVSYKGLPTLLAAWRDWCVERSLGTLVLVGEGSQDMHDCERALREAIDRDNLQARVRLVGAVTAVEPWLQASDLFVFPTENEAFGLSLVEAMSCGLPVVTTGVGGIQDYVEHDRDAWVIPPQDAQALLAGLRQVLDDPAMAERLGRAARDKVAARFSEAVVAAAYERLFAQLLYGRPPGAAA